MNDRIAIGETSEVPPTGREWNNNLVFRKVTVLSAEEMIEPMIG